MATIKNYKTDHAFRGKAIIFNHEKFSNSYSERKGTNTDVDNLKKTLPILGFKETDILVFNDLAASEIFSVLEKVQKYDHTECDLLMIFVLTHGEENDLISASDIKYPIAKLWNPFTADKCKSLAGKPKIFFVVACRGALRDPGYTEESKTEVDATVIEKCNSYSMPIWSDFLYVFSTNKGFLSHRHTEEGTWYIQAFCNELLKTKINEISFTDFLSKVNGRVAVSFETDYLGKQIPIFSCTLTKCLYLKNKKTEYKESKV